ncbi:hypothetical protein [Meridianimarinicoccus roseus]|uniref:hypothetical protein n=1 Tax=Meridianimarinicoccus roseus TaxID=2072018 RepID=UPI001EE66039|nr:hypothetical protein [Meridianimarinicoccus roseus]
MHLTTIEPEANWYRFFSIEIAHGLFCDCGLVREREAPGADLVRGGAGIGDSGGHEAVVKVCTLQTVVPSHAIGL